MASPMQRRAKFSLAAALFGWPPAQGYAEPSQLAPDSWLAQFREQHATLSPAVLNGLFTACPAGRDWVLEAAQKVTLTLDTTAEQTPAQWQRRMSALSSALGARGSRPVRLDIACDGSTQSSAAGYVLTALFSGLDVAVTELVLRDTSIATAEYPCMPITGLLYAAVSAFGPHLTTLSLDPCPCALPPPDLLPQLRSLTVTGPGHLAWSENFVPDPEFQVIASSIAAYISQLTVLTVNTAAPYDMLPWSALSPPTPSQTLTSLSTDTFIGDELISLVVESLPALQTLQGSGVVCEEVHDDTQWGVGVLQLSDRIVEGWTLAMLPTSAAQAVVSVKVKSVSLCCGPAGMDPGSVDRLSDFSFNCETITLIPLHGANWSQSVGLRRALRQLCDGLQTSGGVSMSLMGFEWDTDMLRGYVQAMPALAERGVAKHVLPLDGAITDAMPDILMQAGPHLRSLSAPSLALHSDKHANTPWPWDELTIDTLDIAELCKLPDPAGQWAPRKVVCQELLLSQKITQANVE